MYFMLLKITTLDFRFMIIYSPKLIMALFLTYSEFCLYRFVKSEFGKYISKLTLTFYLFSMYTQNIANRLFTNALEAQLFCIGLYFYSLIPHGSKWKGNSFTKSSVLLTIIVSVLLMIRTSAVFAWIPFLFDKVIL